MPDADRLDELLRQLTTARRDARVCIEMGEEVELRRFRDALYIVRALPRLEESFELAWDGRGTLALPQLGGVLRFARRKGMGISVRALRAVPLRVRVRRGSETLRLRAGGRRRTVRNLLQEAGLPPWLRERLPFLFLGDELAAVPGLGVDVAFHPESGQHGLLPIWTPD
jgi:tRNA(Ile)-lysidine synthase